MTAKYQSDYDLNCDQSKFITINAFQAKVLTNQWISLDRDHITRDESLTHKFPKAIAIRNAISREAILKLTFHDYDTIIVSCHLPQIKLNLEAIQDRNVQIS